MRDYYKGTNVEYPNLFFEVSRSINYYLKGYNIAHTKAEVVLLRDNVLKRLQKAGITNENYDDKKWKMQVDAINLEINNFYNTNHCLSDLRYY